MLSSQGECLPAGCRRKTVALNSLHLPPSFAASRFCNTEQTSGMDPKIREWQASSVPLKRFSEPHEQGEPAVLLLSDKASYITGTQLREFVFVASLTSQQPETDSVVTLSTPPSHRPRRWFHCLVNLSFHTSPCKCHLIATSLSRGLCRCHSRYGDLKVCIDEVYTSHALLTKTDILYSINS